MNINDLPEEIELKLVPMLSAYGYITVHEKLLDGYVQIGAPFTVKFKTISKDVITKGVVDNLKAESQKIRADAEVKCKLIDEKINTLLALPDLKDD